MSEGPESPYAPPASRLDSPAVGLQLASLGQRFANYLVDSLATVVLNFANGVLLALAGQRPGLLARFAISNLITLAYYAVLEGGSGRTLGKLVTGTRVVAEDGAELTLSRVVGRTLARLIPFEPFSFLGAAPVGWHDSLSKTRVIQTR